MYTKRVPPFRSHVKKSTVSSNHGSTPNGSNQSDCTDMKIIGSLWLSHPSIALVIEVLVVHPGSPFKRMKKPVFSVIMR